MTATFSTSVATRTSSSTTTGSSGGWSRFGYIASSRTVGLVVDAFMAELVQKAEAAKTKGKDMRRDITSRKAPEADAVDLGPDNIFAQMGEPDPDERHLKSTLVTRLRAAIADRKLTKVKAAEILGIAQSKVSELLSGAASGFTAERLIHLLNKVGVSVSLAFRQEPGWRPGETIVHFDRDADDMTAPEPDQAAEQDADLEMPSVPSMR